jgi:hypothetical protein
LTKFSETFDQLIEEMAKKLMNWPKSGTFGQNRQLWPNPWRAGEGIRRFGPHPREQADSWEGPGGSRAVYSKDTPVPVTSENTEIVTFLFSTGGSFQKPAFFSIPGEPPSGTHDHFWHIWPLFAHFDKVSQTFRVLWPFRHTSTPLTKEIIEILKEICKLFKEFFKDLHIC